MAHQARLLNSFCCGIVILLLFSCSVKKTVPTNKETIAINADSADITVVNGQFFKAGQAFTGIMYSFFENSSDTALRASFENGKEHGEWKTFYNDGKVKEHRFFAQGQKTGLLTSFWPNGNKQIEYFFEGGEYEGECKEWSEAGTLNKVMHYKDGQEDGSQKWWYDNGKIKANYVIKNGRRYGLLGTKNCSNVSDSVFLR